MNQKVFKYLKDYNSEPVKVDRLIVSAFIKANNLNVKNNKFIRQYLVDAANELEYEKVKGLVSIILHENSVFDFEGLIELFEFVISPSDRVVNGAIYTPEKIREYIVSEVFSRESKTLQNATIADIACGCSGFLYTASKKLRKRTGNSYQHIFQYQIFGLDIQEYSVTRSKLLLSLLALSEGEDVEEFHFNIHQGDALAFRWEQHYLDFHGFQIIVGNPPYVCARNMGDDVRKQLKNWSVSSSGNPDLYIPFFQIGYENLAENGILGFITMNTFFKSLNGRALRSYLEENKTAIRIVDFGTHQVFKSKNTYTCICFLEKVKQDYVEYYRSVNKELPTDRKRYSKVNFRNLDAKKGWNLKDNEVISRIEAMGTPFGGKYKTRHGIATLKNDLYIFTPVKEDNEFYYLKNGNIYPIEKGICKDILNSNKLSRNVNLDDVKEKLLFPYDDEVKPKALEEKVLKEQFPHAYNYLKQKKKELAKRDKGKGKYEKWFAFGRTQSLEKVGNKLFFPKFSDKPPNCLISSDDNLLFYNGQAIVGHSFKEMMLIKRILESRLFWYYIRTTSKPYSSDYYSLNGTYINNFGIPDFTDQEIDFIINEQNQSIIDAFLEEYYDIQIN
jgi:methylase of polypeptide subunit release factors